MISWKWVLLHNFVFTSFCVFIEANETDNLIELLVQKIGELEKRNGDMELKVASMERDFRIHEMAMSKRISRLERQNEILRKEKTEAFASSDNPEGLKEGEYDNVIEPTPDKENTTEDMKMTTMVKKTTMKETKEQRQQARIGKASTKNRHIRSVPERDVAFFATVTPHDLHHLGVGQNIVFDHALTNTGNAYHTTHGIFTAPVDGIYVFSATISGYYSGSNGGNFYAHFDVNGLNVAKLINLKPEEQSTQMTILQLKVGDDVSIKTDRENDSILGDKYTSFSGFLLYQTSSETIVGK